MSSLGDAERILREAFKLPKSSDPYSARAREFMKGRPVDRHNPVIMEQFDVLRRCLDRANDSVTEGGSGILDHLDHIRTEIGRLKYQLAQDGIIPEEKNKNGGFEG
jgi:hypothetical protein